MSHAILTQPVRTHDRIMRFLAGFAVGVGLVALGASCYVIYLVRRL